MQFYDAYLDILAGRAGQMPMLYDNSDSCYRKLLDSLSIKMQSFSVNAINISDGCNVLKIRHPYTRLILVNIFYNTML